MRYAGAILYPRLLTSSGNPKYPLESMGSRCQGSGLRFYEGGQPRWQSAGCDPEQVTTENLWRDQILAAQAAGLSILGPQQDRTRSWARDQAAVETYPAGCLEVQTADNPRRFTATPSTLSGVVSNPRRNNRSQGHQPGFFHDVLIVLRGIRVYLSSR
jgi:hypothetical protein